LTAHCDHAFIYKIDFFRNELLEVAMITRWRRAAATSYAL